MSEKEKVYYLLEHDDKRRHVGMIIVDGANALVVHGHVRTDRKEMEKESKNAGSKLMLVSYYCHYALPLCFHSSLLGC